MKKYLFILAAAFTMLAACEKDQNGDGNGSLKENPNPTSISSLYLAKTEIAVDPDGFNMLTDGGFENFIGDENWKSKSLYYMPEYVSEAETPLTGSRSLHANVGFDGWGDVAVQSICVKKNKSYTLSLWYQGAWKGLNAYMGFRGADPHDVNTNNAEKNDVWEEYTYTFENVDDIKVDAFFGGWCWYDLWLELDDMKVIPTGSANDSFMPKNAQVTASTLTNASFNDVDSAEKITACKDGDAIWGILHNVKMGEKNLHNVLYTAKSDMKIVTVG
ncbi:MAG: hypothetical protein IJ504_07425, partial [Bacteroidales bacterium]|nr:hypothetical protein [Bacteroidales bacterium]